MPTLVRATAELAVADASASPAAGGTAALVTAAARGDAAAFAELHRLHGRMVHAIVLRCVPPEDAADLVQDVFLSAWRTLPGLADPAAFGAWIGRIARNRAIDHLRTRRAHVPLPADLSPPARPVTEAREILQILRTLPEAYAETLLMRLVEGMTGPEIAVRTGMTEGSVRVNLHRGMTLLRERLGRERTP